ncbi:M35 family metallo-endopeptidase [Reyranella sp. CPCC 100927]|uniref:M35 family metallo-endopeptidase n=1 Tax=Reyranella sp. CPCC 100927 TaxID=2599616 RepID=UPI0015B71867|nr:M35 family metallo-endopeptidase [Reyranella sp. CPCC 100927]
MSVTFNGFGTVPTDLYNAAFMNAKTLVHKAAMSAGSLLSLPTTSPTYKNAKAAFTRFWGKRGPASVSAKLNAIYIAMVSQDWTINYDPSENAYAYVLTSDCVSYSKDDFTARIAFCPPLVNTLSALGTNSAAGTIIHEISHLVLGTEDIEYGMKSCSELEDRDKIINADNFQYYCELFQLTSLAQLPVLSDNYNKKHWPPKS